MTFEGGFLKVHLNSGNQKLKLFGSKHQQHYEWTSVDKLNNKKMYIMTS